MTIQQLKSNFDVVSFLESRHIKYWKEGSRNVGHGVIGIRCPYCGDPSNHLGINLIHKGFRCLYCGQTGDIVDLIQVVDDVGFVPARGLLRDYQNKFVQRVEEKKSRYTTNDRRTRDKNILPDSDVIELGKEPKLVIEYMNRRRFDLSICQRHKLCFSMYGEYPLRLIVPVIVDDVVITFQAVDVTGMAVVPYIPCPISVAGISIHDAVYGLDMFVGDQVILVEGVTDKWRMGGCSIAMFGKGFSVKQLIILADKFNHDMKIKVLFDPDATEDGNRLAGELASIFRNVKFIDLEGDKDPADLSDREVMEIINL